MDIYKFELVLATVFKIADKHCQVSCTCIWRVQAIIFFVVEVTLIQDIKSSTEDVRQSRFHNGHILRTDLLIDKLNSHDRTM